MTQKRKTTLIILSFLLLLAAGAVYYGYREYYRTNTSLERSTPNFTMAADELINSFSSDEKGANAKFLDRIIQVNGTIKSVDKDEKGYYTLVISNPTSMSSVRCSMDSLEMQKASLVKTDQTLAVKGICTGYNADEMGLGADVILNRCIIVEN